MSSMSASEFQEVEVHLRRQKSGFGFRILGGEEPGQPVSPEAQEKARTLELTHALPKTELTAIS